MTFRSQNEDEALPVLTVSDAELRAYVEDRLSPGRRSEIEGFLACNPDLAARVMQALHGRDRSALPYAGNRGRRVARSSRVLAACLACGVAGWGVAEALDDEGPFHDLSLTPQYVEEAVMSQRATRVRMGMSSQPETPTLDPAEIRSAMHVRLPVLPDGWRLLDVQVYPSDDGPGVNLLFEARPGQELSLFAVRADTRVKDTPVVTWKQGEYAAYWELGETAYVLTGQGSRDEILSHAAVLSRSALM